MSLQLSAAASQCFARRHSKPGAAHRTQAGRHGPGKALSSAALEEGHTGHILAGSLGRIPVVRLQVVGRTVKYYALSSNSFSSLLRRAV